MVASSVSRFNATLESDAMRTLSPFPNTRPTTSKDSGSDRWPIIPKKLEYAPMTGTVAGRLHANLSGRRACPSSLARPLPVEVVSADTESAKRVQRAPRQKNTTAHVPAIGLDLTFGPRLGSPRMPGCACRRGNNAMSRGQKCLRKPINRRY